MTAGCRGPWLAPTCLALCLGAAACAGPVAEFKAEIEQSPLIARPTREAFGHCSGHGCAKLETVSLSAPEWQRVRQLFQPAAPDAAEERRRIAQAVGRLERLSGPRTGTQGDLGGTWPGVMSAGQLDCVDETLNTRTALRLLARDGLLAWHDLGAPAARGNIIGGLPHRTAVVIERATGTAWAIDSWFYDNGIEPEVVALASWLDGWHPAD